MQQMVCVIEALEEALEEAQEVCVCVTCVMGGGINDALAPHVFCSATFVFAVMLDKGEE